MKFYIHSKTIITNRNEIILYLSCKFFRLLSNFTILFYDKLKKSYGYLGIPSNWNQKVYNIQRIIRIKED